MEINSILLFLILLTAVAFLYSSVGHGGASGYLALMAFFSFAPNMMKPTALLLNLFVAAIAFFQFYKRGYLNFKLFLSFAMGSIPAAFFGGLIEVDESLYKQILAVLLIVAIFRLLNISGNSKIIVRPKLAINIVIGILIGFLSGLIGIGGGIILTPVILILNWGEMKEAAAVSALFIWVNSASGMIGQLVSGITIELNTFIYVAMAIIGGYFGSHFGSTYFNNKLLRYLLALVLLMASIKLVLI